MSDIIFEIKTLPIGSYIRDPDRSIRVTTTLMQVAIPVSGDIERARIAAIIRARREQYRVDGWQAQADAMSLLLDKIEKLP